MFKHINLSLAACCLTLSAPTAQAQNSTDVEMPASCAIQDQTAIIRIVLCNGTFDSAELANVGRAACESALPCGAWIYLDDTDMPLKAPDNHDGLTQKNVTGASAVWIAEEEQLVEISKANAKP